MHPATDGSAALAPVGRPSHEVSVYLDDALGPERAAIAVHIDAWASLVDTASAAQLAVVPLITADELARFCRSDRSPVVLVYDTRSAPVVAAHLFALARLVAPGRFRAADCRLPGARSAPNQGTS